ncbi:helix-turn-helix transcriptional regulator [Nocardia wallacei]|uniref:helix-turn-helix transcriptional regulator n=1 Tax=Nocardia wallacei TaxID=480035 RepID=UPI002455CBA8|nr:helix-turn-helix transcriptional regulator [Nocardia wallacei]
MGNTAGQRRRCQGCGGPLARDNTTSRCAACTGSARTSLHRPPPLPPGFWDDATVRAALADRHMGRVIAAYRRHRGHRVPVRQADVAAWAGLSQARLSRLETGPATQRLDDLVFWARLLDVPPHLLWFQLPGIPHPVLESSPDPVTPARGGRYRLLRFDDHLPPDEADLAAMETFRDADRTYGGGRLYAEVLDYWNTRLSPRLFSGDDDPTPKVFAAAAGIVEMAGWMAHDAGRDDRAERQFRRALDLSKLGGDRQLTIHIHASRAHLALHDRRPADAIRQAYDAEMALSKAPSNSELTARVLAMQARGLAALGEARQARRLLDRAEHTLDAAMPAVLSPWVSRFDLGSLASEAARSLRHLGDLTAAARAAQRIIDLRPPDRGRSRALGQLTLAAILTDQGHPDHACALARDVLTHTGELASYPVVHHFTDLRTRLERYRSPAVTEFLDGLDHALRTKTWIPAPTNHGARVRDR